jgi:hypothetical protein
MNIFVTSSDPRECARYLDSVRVNKMILESIQLLSTALHETGASDLAPYRKTHVNHPCAIWARASRENYAWLLEHTEALIAEYFLRSGKDEHGCVPAYLKVLEARDHLPSTGLTPHPNCTDFKHLSLHEAYLIQLSVKWAADSAKGRTPKFR